MRVMLQLLVGMDYDWLPVAVAVTAASIALGYDASRERARYRNGQIRFRPGRYLRFAGYVAVLLPIVAVLDMVRNHRYAEMSREWPLFTLCSVFFVAIGYRCPRTISVDATGVRRSGYFGIGATRVVWNGAHAVVDPNTGKVTVCGAGGEQVVHTPWHTDRLGFIIQLERRIKVYKVGSRP
jgi:hypothetical protein